MRHVPSPASLAGVFFLFLFFYFFTVLELSQDPLSYDKPAMIDKSREISFCGRLGCLFWRELCLSVRPPGF